MKFIDEPKSPPTKGDLRFKKLKIVDDRGRWASYKTLKETEELQFFNGVEWKKVPSEREYIYLDD